MVVHPASAWFPWASLQSEASSLVASALRASSPCPCRYWVMARMRRGGSRLVTSYFPSNAKWAYFLQTQHLLQQQVAIANFLLGVLMHSPLLPSCHPRGNYLTAAMQKRSRIATGTTTSTRTGNGRSLGCLRIDISVYIPATYCSNRRIAGGAPTSCFSRLIGTFIHSHLHPFSF